MPEPLRNPKHMTSSAPRKPNLFIAGFPKCGTTAIFQYISTHPDVHLSFPKEPHYFIERAWHRHPAKTEREYLKLFKGAPANARAIVDSSALYIYSPEALRRMREFNPEARIIIMLRNPLDMVVSFHRYSYRTFVEDVADFDWAWNLQEARARGEQLPQDCEFPIRLQYENLGMMGKHVAALLDIWPASQVKLVFMEEFIRAPLQHYKELLEFAGLPYDGRTEFPRVNEGGAWKSRTLGKLMMRLWPTVIAVVNRTGLSRLVRKPQFWMFLWGLNSATEEKIVLSPETRKMLQGRFAEDIGLLAQITGRDLSHWLD